MILKRPFLQTETSFGQIILEYHTSSDHPFVIGLNDVSQNSYQELAAHFEVLTKIAEVFNHHKLEYVNPGNYPQLHHFTIGGWFINGNILTKTIDGVATVNDLLVYYLNNEYYYKNLSMFHRAVIAEIVEKQIPEEILKNPAKFDKMLELRSEDFL